VNQDQRKDDQRLMRVESKIDVLTESVSKLIAVETHIVHLVSRVDRIENRIDKVEDRQRTAATVEASSSGSTEMFERIVLVIVSSVIAIAATLVVEKVISQ